VQQLESREQAMALIAAVEALPPEQRHAFLLQAEAGMSVDEIARVTGASFETTKSRLRYARSQLRQLLKEFA
jgi:RNA polymerase sigma factor (sigma-70 family)